jgi:tetratricopeptide (TPR) repeat protein
VVKGVVLAAGGRQLINLTLQPGDDVPVIIEHANTLSVSEPAIPAMQFSDTPNFSVAGVTDYSNVGLHGSDAKVRTSDSLAKDTAALKSSPSEKGVPSSAAGDAHRRFGDEKERNGDPVGAVNEYQTAVTLDPSEENYFAWGAELLLHRAGLAAVQVFSRGTVVYPKSSRMRAGLGAAYYASGQYSEAATQMCQASDLDPTNSQPYLFLGEMENAAADLLPFSEGKLARFAAKQPGSAQANFYYGLVLWKKARKTQNPAGFSSAETYFRKAADLDPQFGEAQLQLGLLYNERGQKDAARDAFEKAVARTPALSAAHYQLGLAYRRVGDAARADQEMTTYEELRRSEDAELQKQRRQLRQFVTVLKDTKPASH